MKIVLTPDWFLGTDVLIEIFSFFVLFLFTFLSYKNYKFDKNKKFLYLGIGFGLIAIAQFATILTKLILYYDTTLTQTIGQIVITYEIVKSVDLFYYLGFFIHRLFTLFGLYIIYKLPIKKKQRGDFFLTIFFITVIAILSKEMTYLFRLTALVLLVLITRNFWLVYKKNKSKKTLLLIFAFGILAIANIIFTFSGSSLFFAVANVFELVSYITLLFLIIRILEHGKEKKQNGYNLRHIGNNPRKRRKN